MKHVGRLIKSKRRVIVAYRVVPNEPENCIVIATDSLDAGEHDTLMQIVESEGGQNENDIANLMMRTRLPDGRNMLTGFHNTGKMMKMSTDEVEMTPDTRTTINLAELNELIAQQQGISVADLAIQPNSANEAPKQPDTPVEVAATDSEVITDEDLAAKYRSDADRLFKEAKRLREEAEKLSPTKRKTKTVESA